MDSNLWWNGPDWLSDFCHSTVDDSSDFKLTGSEYADAEDEAKGQSRACNVNTPRSLSLDEMIGNLIETCSTLTKIERSLAFCVRFISNCRKKKEDRTVTKLTLAELELARREIFKYSQRICFKEDLNNLQNGDTLSPASRLR